MSSLAVANTIEELTLREKKRKEEKRKTNASSFKEGHQGTKCALCIREAVLNMKGIPESEFSLLSLDSIAWHKQHGNKVAIKKKGVKKYLYNLMRFSLQETSSEGSRISRLYHEEKERELIILFEATNLESL
jgi:hypothetical protein